MAGRILLFTQDPGRSAPLIEALRRAYFDTVAAPELREGQRPDLVLVDARGDGGPLAKATAFRGGPMGKDLPLIALVDRAEAAASAFAMGADDIIWDHLPIEFACARIRALSRLRSMSEEVALRDKTSREFGLEVSEDGAFTPRVLFASPPGSEADPTLRLIAQRLGADLIRVESGAEALSVVQRATPEIAIIDCALAPQDDPAALSAAIDATLEGRGTIFTLSGRMGADLSLAEGADALAARLRGHLRLIALARRLRGGFENGLRLAATDALTGCFNRRYLEAHLGRLFETSRATGAPLSLLMIDIDRFKDVNDTYGHGAGDAALRTIAERIRATIRRGDLAARFGGDEFLVAMPDETRRRAAAVAERIRSVVADAPIDFPGGRMQAPTISFGVAERRSADADAASLLRRADLALLHAKRFGRDRVVEARDDRFLSDEGASDASPPQRFTPLPPGLAQRV